MGSSADDGMAVAAAPATRNRHGSCFARPTGSSMAQAGRLFSFSLLALAALEVSGCFDSHGRPDRPPLPTPVIDAGATAPDARAPTADAFVCLDCSCCSCGRPSSGFLCPLTGLEACCLEALGVDAFLSSATLGDDCPTGPSEDCAGGVWCGCQQTSVQLRFVAMGPAGR